MSTPRFKVYRAGEYVAAVKYPEDAAALIAGGGVIKDGHSRIVYRADATTGDSYDDVAAQVWENIHTHNTKMAARRVGNELRHDIAAVRAGETR